jgi:hypothetical protein
LVNLDLGLRTEREIFRSQPWLSAAFRWPNAAFGTGIRRFESCRPSQHFFTTLLILLASPEEAASGLWQLHSPSPAQERALQPIQHVYRRRRTLRWRRAPSRRHALPGP